MVGWVKLVGSVGLVCFASMIGNLLQIYSTWGNLCSNMKLLSIKEAVIYRDSTLNTVVLTVKYNYCKMCEQCCTVNFTEITVNCAVSLKLLLITYTAIYYKYTGVSAIYAVLSNYCLLCPMATGHS